MNNTQFNLSSLSEKFVTQSLAYLKIADIISTFSLAARRKVGSVIVAKNGRIIGTGFNGVPSGVMNKCESEDDVTYDYVIHAEVNAIFNATTNDLAEATLYITDSPCLKCAAAIKQKQFKQVIYTTPYTCLDGVKFLEEHGIPVISQLQLIELQAQRELFTISVK